MAERIVQEESLTTVADAIRAKAGTTDPLSFPTGFADAIAAIQTGGGGVKVAISNFVPATNITNKTSITVENPLGAVPDFVLIAVNDAESNITKNLNMIWLAGYLKTDVVSEATLEHIYSSACVYVTTTTSSKTTAYIGNTAGFLSIGNYLLSGSASPINDITEDTLDIVGCAKNSIPFLQAGVNYKMILGVYE